jgi:putative PIN family toxin of toxin-antitoxin system
VRVLLDTNVLVAALVSHGACHELLEHCYQNHLIVTSKTLMTELRKVMAEKIGFSRGEVREAMQVIADMVEIAEPARLESPVCRDPDDDEVLAAAIGAGADCIVTGDSDLLVIQRYEGVPILAPEQFWRHEKE